MKKSIVTLLTLAAIGSTVYGGGDIAPVYEPVITEPQPVATPLSPVYYVGGGVAIAGLSRDCPCNNNDRLKDMTYGLALRAGADIIDYIGIELRYLNTFIEEDFSSIEHYGLYLKPHYEITPEASVYGLLGYGKTTVDCKADRRSFTLSKSGLAYGAGVEFTLQDNIGVWADISRLLSGEGKFDTDLNVATAGVLYRFDMQ